MKCSAHLDLVTSFLNFSKPPKFYLSRLLTTQNAADQRNQQQQQQLSCQTRILNNKDDQSSLLHWEHESSFSTPFALNKIISFCAKSPCLTTGIQLHSTVIKLGFTSNLYINSALIHMYGANGEIFSAQTLFDEIPVSNVVCWNSLISAYVHNNSPHIAVKQFVKMSSTGIKATSFTISDVLVGCSRLEEDIGAQLHCFSLKLGFLSDVVIGTGLLDMYSKYGKIEDSRRIFDEMIDKNVITWTAMISGYGHHGLPDEAMALVKEMLRLGLRMNHVTYNSLLTSFFTLDYFDYCTQVHCRIIQDGLENNVFILVTLLTVYSKCSCTLEDFQKLCTGLSKSDQVSSNAVIAGFCNLGYDEKAIQCFLEMRQAGIHVDLFTFTSMLGAIGNSSAIEEGKQLHALILKSGFVSNINVQNGLLSMYARCGMINDSKMVFSLMEEHDVISWNSFLSGCAFHGYGKETLEFFEQMTKTDTKPDGITFLALLSACSHVGFLDKGLEYFELMKNDAMLELPRLEHYAAVVNLFSRAGHLDEAEAFINSMPIDPGPSVYKALLSACEVHGNVEIASRSAKKLLERWPNDPTTYVLLSKLLKMVDDWDEAAGVCKLMSDRGVKKNPGFSWI